MFSVFIHHFRTSRNSIRNQAIFWLLVVAAQFMQSTPSFAETGLALRGALGISGPDAVTVIGASPIWLALQSVSLRTVLVGLHVVGLIIGFGAVLFLDIYLVRFLYDDPITQPAVSILRHGERLITVGLAILWMSGLGFLLQYYLWSPEKLDNPKLVVKVAVVLLLSVNGILLHRVVAPLFQHSKGRPLLAGATLGEAFPVLGIAAISAASWTTAAVLGLARELNNVVPCALLFECYVGFLCAMLAAGCMYHLYRHHRAGRDWLNVPSC